jgi:hypothetical protein
MPEVEEPIFEVEDWLSRNGYSYHCFVSWAYGDNPKLLDWATKLKTSIQNELGTYFSRPSVYLWTEANRVGTVWQEALREALCESISLVAVCTPVYFHPDHEWCGREWAAMTELSKKRLGDTSVRSTLPVFMRKPEGIPEPVAQVQYIDLSAVATLREDYDRSAEYEQRVQEIVREILLIARLVKKRQIRARCKRRDFQIPPDSAFLQPPHPKHLPFRSRRRA